MKNLFQILRITAIAPWIMFPAVAIAQDSGSYPATLVSALTEACIQESKSPAYCQCMYGKLQQRMPLADFLEFSLRLKSNPQTPIPLAFEQTSVECIQLFRGDPDAIAQLLIEEYGDPQNPKAYPPFMVHTFVQRCQRDGGTPEFCRCTIQETEQNLPLNQFMRWSLSNSPAQHIPIQVQNATAACLPKQILHREEIKAHRITRPASS